MKRTGMCTNDPLTNKKSKTEETNTKVHSLFTNSDLVSIINSFRHEKVPNAQDVTSQMAGYFTPTVTHRGSGELQDGLKHLTFKGAGAWSTLKLPRSLRSILYAGDAPINRLKNLREFAKTDPASYKSFLSRYAKKLNPQKSLEEEFQASYGWPESLKEFKFADFYAHPITEGVLPETLERLEFDNKFDERIREGVLPRTLKKLDMGFEFNQEIHTGDLPESLTHLRLGGNFSQQIWVLPVTHLVIDQHAHTVIHDMETLVAPKLTHLWLTCVYNIEAILYRLNNTALPPNLIHIYSYHNNGHYINEIHLKKTGQTWMRVNSHECCEWNERFGFSCCTRYS